MVKAAALRSTRSRKVPAEATDLPGAEAAPATGGSGIAEAPAIPTAGGPAAADGKRLRTTRGGKAGPARGAGATKANGAARPAARTGEAASTAEASATPQPAETVKATQVRDAVVVTAKTVKARRAAAPADPLPDAAAENRTPPSAQPARGITRTRPSSRKANGASVLTGTASRRQAAAPAARARRTTANDPAKYGTVTSATSTQADGQAARKRQSPKAAAKAAEPPAAASLTLPAKRGGATGRRSRTRQAGPVAPLPAKLPSEIATAEPSGARAAKARAGASKPAPSASSGCAPIKLGFLSDFVGFHLRLAQDASYRAFARFKDKDLVKPGRFPALAIIHLNPGISQSALGRAIARDKSTVSPLIKDLQKNGLITRKPSPNDRRSVTLVLTKKGERVLDRLHVRAREHERDLDKLVGASKSKLVGLLDKITDALT